MADASTAPLPEVSLYRARLVRSFIEKGPAETLRTFQLDQATLDAYQELEWWSETAKTVYGSQAQDLDRQMTRLIDKALEQADNRLEHGDQVLDKFGERHLVPIKGKEAAVMAALFLDKRQVVRGLPNAIIRSDVKSLDAIAEKLRSIVRGDPVASVVLDPKQLEREALNGSATVLVQTPAHPHT